MFKQSNVKLAKTIALTSNLLTIMMRPFRLSSYEAKGRYCSEKEPIILRNSWMVWEASPDDFKKTWFAETTNEVACGMGLLD